MEKIKLICCCKDITDNSSVDMLVDLLENQICIVKGKITKHCLADAIMDDIDEEDETYLSTYRCEMDFQFKNENYSIQMNQITNNKRRFLECEIKYLHEYKLIENNNSNLYDFKEKLITMIESEFEQIFWLYDTQNTKIAKDLYDKIHVLENYLRSIVDRYMVFKYGFDWFEKYSFEDHINKYQGFSEWYKKSRYELFGKVDNHMYNLQTC